MSGFWALALAIWAVGAGWRCQQLARFLQQETYLSGRFLRGSWRRRALPLRTLLLAGLALALTETAALHALAAVLAILPLPRGGVVKTPLRWTGRLWRMLALAWGLVAALAVVAWWQFGAGGAPLTLFGLVVYAAAPLLLAAANLAAAPIEAAIRRRYRQQAAAVLARQRPTVIGITGSWGKTSTKHILTELLAGRRRVYATPKSYNTLMGVTLAINRDLRDDYSVDTFLVEMGAYRRGEIAEICQLVQPTVALLVDIGPQHLERFGTIEETTRAKFEMVEALPEDGLAVYNWDSVALREEFVRRPHPKRRIAISRDESAPPVVRLVATDAQETLAGLACRIHDREMGECERLETGLLGEHNVTNLLLASAVALEFGVTLREIAWRARQIQPFESRLQRQQTAAGITILNDGYSANPLGARSALQTLGLHESGRRLLVTPGMVELGAGEAAANQRLGELAARYATDVILVDERRAPPIASGLRAAGFPEERLRVVSRFDEAVAWYQRELRAGDTVLFLNDLPDAH